MKLVVYKGFDEEFLSTVKEEPLVEGTITTKLDVLKFDKKTRKQLDIALISLEESDEAFDRLKDIVELKLSLLNTELIPIADISSTMRMVRLLRSVQEVFLPSL